MQEQLTDEQREADIRELSAQMLLPAVSNAERRMIGLRIRELINGRSAEVVRALEVQRGLRAA